MLPRILRTSAAAVRHFSTKTAVAAATVQEKVWREGRDVSGNRSAAGSTGRDTLGRRLFALVYRKRSAVIAIRKWKEEGNVVQKYELNRIVRELRKLKRYKHALEVCEWMRLQEDIQLVPGDYAVHLDLIAKIRGLTSAEKFFEDLPEKMRDHTTCSSLLHAYVQHNEYNKAEAVMKKMSECGFLRSPLPFNHMLTLYISSGDLEKVPELIKEAKKTTSLDIVTYNLWLSACASENLAETAEKVFNELCQAKLEPDWMTYSTMASIYIKNSLREKAESALKEMEKKVTKNFRPAYSSLISLHTALENKKDVNGIWKKMKFTFRKLNDAEYTCMLISLLKLKDIEGAEKLHAEWESVSPTKDSKVSNLLLSAYINNDQMEKAEAFYDRMVQNGIVPGYITWEILTYAYLKQRQVDKVLDCFTKAVKSVRKWDPDEKLVQEIYNVVEECGDIAAAEKLLTTLRRACCINTDNYNSLIRTYAKAGKMPLIMAERMKKDNVEMDEETKRLLQLTSKMCVSEIPIYV